MFLDVTTVEPIGTTNTAINCQWCRSDYIERPNGTALNSSEVDIAFLRSKMAHWKGKVALVTGASSGIGAGLCGALVKLGMVVVGCARRPDRINSLSEKIAAETVSGKLVGVKCDLTQENDILETFDYIKRKYNRLDVCINSAGLSHDSPLLSGSTEYFRNMLETNILALTVCNREAFKLMHETKEMGQIINMSSLGVQYYNTTWTVHFTPMVPSSWFEPSPNAFRKDQSTEKDTLREFHWAVRTRFYNNSLKMSQTTKPLRWLSPDVGTLRPRNIIGCILPSWNAPPHWKCTILSIHPLL
ncbi:hypothetical protein CDAR_66501 [Caerostris darwini]|uniref:Dehydrogenase/reductase SDR family member 11 n=1 Tax=Caerostris darwini TaxID=1538125 RepID=A0AAV4X034_9ARAC|nr:hypothetical protein CDAR_66501 [Caerostris darwini]